MKTLQTIRLASPDTPSQGDAPLRRWELAGISGLALVWLWFRSVSVYHHPWDSDEPQHLHVVWGWTQGLLPYRDFFDNHTPLFHLLFAPVFNLFGERADIIDLMRWCMVPLVALILWCTYRLGAQVFSRRIGIVAALLCAFYPNHYFKVGEFRTDTLWTLLWMATLVLLTKPRQSQADRFLAGLAFGAAFATSQKTAMLSLALILGTCLAYLLALGSNRRTTAAPPARSLALATGAFTLSFWLGLILIPGLLLAFFYIEDAWSQVVYCVVRHNLVTVAEADRAAAWADLRSLRFWLIIPATVAGWVVLRRSKCRDRAERQVWVVMIAGSYCTVLLGIWTVISAQDYLPYFPVSLVAVAAGVFWLWRQISWRFPPYPWLPLLLLVVVFGFELSWLVKNIRFSDRQNRFKVEQIREALALARPDEPVLDAKGGTVYRPRAIPYVMETLTRLRMREGLLANDIDARLVANRTTVAVNFSWFPKSTQNFISRNYLYVGLVHVAGQQIYPDAAGMARFRLEIPNRYVFIDAHGSVPGSLDGGSPASSFDIVAGEHFFRANRDWIGPCYLLAESAYAAGFTPFNKELAALEPQRRTTD